MSSYKAFPDVEAAKDMPLSRPDHFISTVKPHHISKCRMHVPKLFARENGLSNTQCTIVIRDYEQRLWEFRLYSSSAGSTFIGGEWRKFCAANFLKEGDCIMFEIFAKGEKPILKFYGKANASLQPEEWKPNLDAERYQSLSIASAPRAHSQSLGKYQPLGLTLRSYGYPRSLWCIPTRFAAENGLTNKNCGLIIRDETQRSWNLRLYTSCSRVYIGGRWGEFRVANDLEVGDRIMFEIVTNGEKPIWKFHGKFSH
ncbi:putative b3 domain-containing protein rem4 [Nicotiana attenuata]|uniref:B3 domain-containing protein rem4 n=1 Tax=Nicotiana attenuata TaxID=49451 RepID=A0A1J6IR57_NICAT|nr:putative b3 domain-containing protein rem4 [Nicotiana attenuata]